MRLREKKTCKKCIRETKKGDKEMSTLKEKILAEIESNHLKRSLK